MTGATYDRIHRTLIAQRGSAVGQPCSHPTCDRPSTGWTLLGHPTRIDVNSHRKTVRLSTNLNDYGPTCARHNAQLDRGGNWTLCPHGHVRMIWGTDSKGACRGRNRFGRKTSRLQVGSIAHVVSTDNTERGRS